MDAELDRHVAPSWLECAAHAQAHRGVGDRCEDAAVREALQVGVLLAEVQGNGDGRALGCHDAHPAPPVEGRSLDEGGEVVQPVRHRASVSRGPSRPALRWMAGTHMAHPHEQLARLALSEDAPGGDITSRTTIPEGTSCEAELVIKQDGVLAGLEVAVAVFETAAAQDGTTVEIDRKAADGDGVRVGDRAALLRGDARTVLRAERPALNLLGHLSGIATLTRAYVDAATPAAILCTRKTLPGLRAVEREAVASGGGTLHRASLSDAILIKDTHVRMAGGATQAGRGGPGGSAAVAGGMTEAFGRARADSRPIEVEVETLDQLGEALAADVDRILLDNPTPDLVREAIAKVGDPQRLEISGGVDLDNVRAFVDAGARVVSVGRLTHSAPAVDVSLEVIGIDD